MRNQNTPLFQDNDPQVIHSDDGPGDSRHVGPAWLYGLPKCNLAMARQLISGGGCLCIHLDHVSTKRNPMWRATVQDNQGQHWALIGVGTQQPRQLKSVQQVYQVARNLSLGSVMIPVDH